MNTQRFASLRASLLLAAAALLVSACSSLIGPRTMTFSEADLQHMLEQHGPFARRLIEVLDVRINHPTVQLLPESNHLASTLEVSTTERLSGKTYHGSLAVEYGLRYDDTLKAIRLTDVTVNKLQIDNLPSPGRAGLHNLGALIAEQLLDGAVLYRFKPSDLKNAEGRGYKPGNVAVTRHGVEVTLVAL